MIYPDSFEHKIGFDAVRASLAELCSSSLGRKWVEEMSFSSDFGTVSRELNSTSEMLAILSGSEAFPLQGVDDMTPALARCRVEGASVSAPELHRIRRGLLITNAIKDFFRKSNEQSDNQLPQASPYPNLTSICEPIESFPALNKAIDRIMDESGEIRDTASKTLAEIRSELSRVSSSLNSIMRRVVARAVEDGFLEQDTTPSVRDGRLVLPVAPMNKRKIQGIVHDESATGKTVFIEPAEIVEANNRVRELEMEERREILRILAEFTAQMRPYIPAILESYTMLGRFDFIMAKARFALDTDATMPSISRERELEWYHAVHPVLLKSLRSHGKEIVPLDISLTAKNRILVISGPNAGGKSVCLKTVGIVQYMLQCGMFPTVYENSHMGLFEDIFIDIGDDQSIEDDLSTYSSHLRNMRQFVTAGSEGTLMLIDEFGSGTEPHIGGAIAQAVLERLNGKRMWGVVTTHFQNLKQFAEDTEGLINGSMQYDRQKMRPLFRLSVGNAGSSFAIEIARKSGLPSEIIDKASELVGSDYVNMDKYLLDIARDKRYWERKRQDIRLKEKRIEQTLERYETDADTLRSKRNEILAEAKNEARQIIEGSNAAIERTIREIRESQADRERTLEARRKMNEEKKRLSEEQAKENALLRKAPKTRKKSQEQKPSAPKAKIEVGDFVKLDGQGIAGQVLSLSSKEATVAFGMLKTNVAVKRLVPTMTRPASGSGAASFVSAETTGRMREKQLNFKREIDVRGMRADEAIQAVTYFIDDAIQFNQKEVRILHGTGTGALRQAIRQYLDTVPGVAGYHDEHVQFGGAGITVVQLS